MQVLSKTDAISTNPSPFPSGQQSSFDLPVSKSSPLLSPIKRSLSLCPSDGAIVSQYLVVEFAIQDQWMTFDPNFNVLGVLHSSKQNAFWMKCDFAPTTLPQPNSKLNLCLEVRDNISALDGERKLSWNTHLHARTQRKKHICNSYSGPSRLPTHSRSGPHTHLCLWHRNWPRKGTLFCWKILLTASDFWTKPLASCKVHTMVQYENTCSFPSHLKAAHCTNCDHCAHHVASSSFSYPTTTTMPADPKGPLHSHSTAAPG